jgi:cell division protein FtsZ
MHFNIPDDSQTIIKVVGVGGGGSNAVNYMFRQGISGVDFAVCNTDNQAINLSTVPTKIQLGPSLTEGRGAGSKPIVGREACLESLEDVKQFFADGTKMIFVTAGMGGGTGTGAAPVIAKAAREMDILTVGIVTTPFTFEGRRRMKQAEEGIAELKKNVDTLIIISNDKLRKIYGNLSLGEAFAKADDILTTAAKGIAEIITVPGYVNVDFEDVNTVMRDSGVAVMGTASMAGEDRARRAVEAALQSPLLEDSDIKGAQHILLNITSGTQEVTMDEVFEITEFVQEAAGYGTDLIWGNCYDESLGEKLAVTVIATGFEIGRSKDGQARATNTTQVAANNSGSGTGNNKNATNQNPPAQNVRTPQQPDKKRISLDEDETPITPSGKKSYYIGLDDEEEENANKKKDKYVIKPVDTTPPVTKSIHETLEERRERLKNLSVKLTNPEVVNDLENLPAYMRKGIHLDNLPPANEHTLSKWALDNNEDEPEIRDNNSFLHDNID